MKTHRRLLAALCGSIVAASGAAESPPLTAFPAEAVGVNETTLLLRKYSAKRIAVLEALGEPGARLSPDIWIYWNYRSSEPNRTEGFDTLLLQFRDDRVVAMKLVNGATVRRFIAMREKRSPA